MRDSCPEFMTRWPTVASRIRDIAESTEKDTLRRGEDASVERSHNSKGHEAIRTIYLALYPHNQVQQNCTVDLMVENKRTPCEFDLVDRTLKIIFEIQGKQHNEYSSHFHQGKRSNFYKQKRRDRMKKVWAAECGWTVIEIQDAEAKKMLKLYEQSDENKQIILRAMAQRIKNAIEQQNAVENVDD